MSEAAVITRGAVNGAQVGGSVLIVDDEAEIRESLQTLLELEGFEVDSAATGEDGLSQIANRPFDLVLLDLTLPGRNGMLFFLSIISDLVGLAGGLMVAKLFLSLDARQYWNNAWQVLVLQDVFMGLLKPVLFGFIIATIGCFYGMTARGGTQGVGRATTQAVVAASVLILVTDFFVTKLLISLLSYH